VLFVIALIVTLVFGIGGHNESDTESREDFLKITKSAFAAVLVSLAVILFVPSESTVYRMTVAKLVTYERVEQANGSLDRIIEKIVKTALDIEYGKSQSRKAKDDE
jgi:hypothetical protein